MRNRNRLLSFVGLFLFLHLSFVAFRRHLEAPVSVDSWVDQSIEVTKDSKGQRPQPNATPPPVLADKPRVMAKRPSKWCQYNECLVGRWKPRTPPFMNLEEFQEAFASRGTSPWHECPIQDPSQEEGKSEEEIKAIKADRLVTMMNYVWAPDRGERVPWDPEDFVVRLLKMPAGIIFLGDSVSAGWEHAFNSYLEQGMSAEKGGIPFVMVPAYVHGEQVPGIRPHILSPGHPKSLELQRRAGVPDSRMKRPIFQIIEEHMLLQPPAIRNITENHGATKGAPWIWEIKRIPGWEDYLQNITTPQTGEDSAITDDSVLVMNTGAHWSRGTLHMLPSQLGSVEEEHTMLADVYKDMMAIMIERLNKLRRVKIFYRATNAAHPGCSAKTRPYRNYEDAIRGESNFVQQVTDLANDARDRRVRLRWDWDRFDVHNGFWREEVSKLQANRKALEDGGVDPTELPPKWLFLDFWAMSLQRPDAHSDCLHWCLPTVYNEWSHHLYHVLHLESGLKLV